MTKNVIEKWQNDVNCHMRIDKTAISCILITHGDHITLPRLMRRDKPYHKSTPKILLPILRRITAERITPFMPSMWHVLAWFVLEIYRWAPDIGQSSGIIIRAMRHRTTAERSGMLSAEHPEPGRVPVEIRRQYRRGTREYQDGPGDD